MILKRLPIPTLMVESDVYWSAFATIDSGAISYQRRTIAKSTLPLTEAQRMGSTCLSTWLHEGSSQLGETVPLKPSLSSSELAIHAKIIAVHLGLSAR
jgi:hypothetical protein